MKREKRWEAFPIISSQENEELAKFSPTLRQILVNRGVRSAFEAENFLAAAEPDSSDPFQLSDMQVAVDRILRAIEDQELICVYGDYDADGVTSTALMSHILSVLNANVIVYIPNRFTEGYGLNNGALDQLRNQGVSLVITVDCGIRAIEQTAHATSIGLDLIITDHHNPGAEIPEALAVVNPKRLDDVYPDKNLAGVGVAYKLATALSLTTRSNGFDPTTLLDLVAIGTVADLVPLRGENRHLVRAGLKRMRRPTRQGLASLMGLTGITPSKMSAASIGFGIGPRLNAAGRLASAMDAYELLNTSQNQVAGRLAQELDNWNRKRQAITREMQLKSEDIAIKEGKIPILLFAAHEDFNAGVVGLAASRLTEQYYRPAIVGNRNEEYTRASCRSVPEFNITEALDQCSDLLEKYGGHAAAAGFTVSNENLDLLIEKLGQLAAEKLGKFKENELIPIVKIDKEVTIDQLTLDFLKELEQLEPTGAKNPRPVFSTHGLKVVNSRVVGRDSSHLKLVVGDGLLTLDAIAFGKGQMGSNMPEHINAVFNFEINEFRGIVTPQLNILDLEAAA